MTAMVATHAQRGTSMIQVLPSADLTFRPVEGLLHLSLSFDAVEADAPGPEP